MRELVIFNKAQPVPTEGKLPAIISRECWMDIKILSKEQDSLRFVLSGVKPAFANALRRIMISEVPIMAIDDVMILENNSVMYDEILAHRLGLIPITTDLEAYNLPEECSCKSELGCSHCRASLSLEIEASDQVEVVYTSHLKPENPDVRPVSDKIPIVKLAQGQRVKLEAFARLGRGRTHAKWQPTSACTYSYDEKAGTFTFLVESTGALPPERIVLEAARIVNSKSMDFQEQVGAMEKS